jgi:hypothetical protein
VGKSIFGRYIWTAESLAANIKQDHLDKRQLFPSFTEIRDISANIGAAVAAKAYQLGLATRLPQPKDLVAHAKSCMYSPTYRQYRWQTKFSQMNFFLLHQESTFWEDQGLDAKNSRQGDMMVLFIITSMCFAVSNLLCLFTGFCDEGCWFMKDMLTMVQLLSKILFFFNCIFFMLWTWLVADD